MSRFFIICIAHFVFFSTAIAVKADIPKVVVSIKPLHSLVSAVMGDLGKPELIVKGVGSEHDYALKPSDAKLLNQADVVFIADKNMEVFLQKPLASLNDEQRIISLSQATRLELLPIRQGGLFEAHHHGEAEEHDHEKHGHEKHGHEKHEHEKHEHEKHEHEKHEHEDAIDYHFWLDPENAEKITLYVAEILSALDEANATIYKANADAYNQRLNQLTKDIEAEIKSVRGQNFLTFHDAYHYFENRFAIEASAAVALDPERPASAKRIQQLKDLIKSQNISCIFKEPQFPNKIINVIIENSAVRIGELDPLGLNLESGPALYEQLIQQNAKNLVDCLAAK